jgi:thioredoxin-like negative regulator of GroEL
MFEKDQKVSKKEYTKAAIWCNSNGHYIEEVNGEYFIRQIAPPTEEEIAAEELAKAKAERAEYVAKLVVTVDDLQFDGDETSQDRMARSCVALNEGETVQWVLADNTIAQVTKEQLRQALRLAGEAQTAIWANPYIKEEPIEE